MKRFYSAILLVSFVIGAIQPFIPALEYHLFKDYIIEHHCLNKDNPNMACDGMCYLHKKIDETHSGHDDHAVSVHVNYYPGAILNTGNHSFLLFPDIIKNLYPGFSQLPEQLRDSPPVPPPQ